MKTNFESGAFNHSATLPGAWQRNILRRFESRASSFGAGANQRVDCRPGKEEGAGGQNSPAPMLGVGRTSFLSRTLNHTSPISSKTVRQQAGDILEKVERRRMLGATSHHGHDDAIRTERRSPHRREPCECHHRAETVFGAPAAVRSCARGCSRRAFHAFFAPGGRLEL